MLIPPADYSKIVSVFFSDISENGYLLYSNPVSQNLKILSNSTGGKLKIYNQLGHLVKEFIANEAGLFNEDISAFAGGLFYFEIEITVGKNLRGKFIKL